MYSVLDITGVVLISLFAAFILLRVFIKLRRNKCATLCNGCDGGRMCSSRSFVAVKGSSNIIPLKDITS